MRCVQVTINNKSFFMVIGREIFLIFWVNGYNRSGLIFKYKYMATIVVEVPDSIAKKFISYDIVPSLELYEELDDEVWTSVKV
jgi:hypothetical protein